MSFAELGSVRDGAPHQSRKRCHERAEPEARHGLEHASTGDAAGTVPPPLLRTLVATTRAVSLRPWPRGRHAGRCHPLLGAGCRTGTDARQRGVHRKAPRSRCSASPRAILGPWSKHSTASVVAAPANGIQLRALRAAADVGRSGP